VGEEERLVFAYLRKPTRFKGLWGLSGVDEGTVVECVSVNDDDDLRRRMLVEKRPDLVCRV